MKEKDKGIIGYLWYKGNHISVNSWKTCEIEGFVDAAKIKCEYSKFIEFKEFSSQNFKNLLGSKWLVRLDSENGFYFGSINCVGMAKPNVANQDKVLDDYTDDLFLYFTFSHSSYGPYTIKESISMAKNGNPVFFDLLNLTSLQEKIFAKDQRFLAYHSMT